LRLVLAVTAFLITAAVALGVIGASMHHFADTVGGAAVGTGTVLATALVLDLLSARLNTAARRESLRTCLPPEVRRSAAGDHELTRRPAERASAGLLTCPHSHGSDSVLERAFGISTAGTHDHLGPLMGHAETCPGQAYGRFSSI